MSSTVQKIKERISIAELIGSYINVEKSGSSLKARCPFHNEKTPSFFISPDRGTYYCFGCGAKGDILSFVQDFEKVDFVTALKMLADRAGVVIEGYEREAKEDNANLYSAMEEATKFFQSKLKDEVKALSYLKNRKLSIEMLRDWKVGYAPSDWRELKNHLIEKGFLEKDLLLAGLIKKNEKGEVYDRFRGRIMFPIFDVAGRVIAFSGRLLEEKDEEPKYLNSPDTPLFDKSKVLYGYHVAKKSIREKGFAILVEGQMDLLLSQQAGFTNTVASSGTALTGEHLSMLKRSAEKLVLAYDADNAGKNATFRAWKLALAHGFELMIAVLPDGLDPADAVAKDAAIWDKAIREATNIVDYFLESVKQEKDEKKADKILKEKVLPLIKSIESNISQSRAVQRTSFATGITENSLWDELSKIKEEDLTKMESENQNLHSQKQNAHRAIGFLLWLRSSNNPYAEAFEENLKKINEGPISDGGEEADALIFEAEMHYGGESNLKKIGEELLKHFEEEKLKRDLSKAMERLKKAEALHDAEAVERELSVCQKISLRLSELKRV